MQPIKNIPCVGLGLLVSLRTKDLRLKTSWRLNTEKRGGLKRFWQCGVKSRELCVLLESLRTYWGIEGVFFYALALKYDEN